MPICSRSGCCVELVNGICPRCNPMAAHPQETVTRVGPPPAVAAELARVHGAAGIAAVEGKRPDEVAGELDELAHADEVDEALDRLAAEIFKTARRIDDLHQLVSALDARLAAVEKKAALDAGAAPNIAHVFSRIDARLTTLEGARASSPNSPAPASEAPRVEST